MTKDRLWIKIAGAILGWLILGNVVTLIFNIINGIFKVKQCFLVFCSEQGVIPAIVYWFAPVIGAVIGWYLTKWINKRWLK